MNGYLLLILQLALPLALTALAMAYLSPALGRLLEDLCGSRDRADFWLRLTWIACALVPVTWLMLEDADAGADVVAAIREILGVSLAGVTFTLALVALVVRRFIPPPAARSGS